MSQCVPGAAGLSGSSLHVWYKALSQELLQQWAGHAAGVVALHKSRQGPLQQEAVDAALEQLKQCGRAFSHLLMLNKVHLKRIQVSPADCVFGVYSHLRQGQHLTLLLRWQSKHGRWLPTKSSQHACGKKSCRL